MRDLINKIVDVNIDFPIGSRHQTKGFIYTVNFGKLVNEITIEAYILGHYEPLNTFKGKVIAIIEREIYSRSIVVVADIDSSYTFKQISALVEFQEKYYKSTLHTAGNYFNKEIRLKTLGIVYRGEDILVEKYDDIVKSETFYRFLGGGINFREKSEIALAREFKEEINASIKIIAHKVTIENIFSFGDSEEHEVVFIYEIRIDEHFYSCDKFEKVENNTTSDVYWINKKKFLNGELTLYPEGILNYI